MSICSSEVCDLSEKKSILKTMAPLLEDPSRASPVPFIKGNIVKGNFDARAQEVVRQSENIQTLDEGNVQVTRRTKVEESLVHSQKMYSAEVSSSSQTSYQVRASSPEMEQIMAKKQVYQSYHDTSRSTPNTLSVQQKLAQSERCLTPEIENLMDKPHGTWSPMPPACFVRPISPHHVISFPPDVPSIPATLPHPRVATPEQFQEARETVERFVDHSKHVQQSHVYGGRTTQSYLQETYAQPTNGQQYTPRFDMNQGFSPYAGRTNQNAPSSDISNRYQSSSENGVFVNSGVSVSGNPGNPAGNTTGNPENHAKENLGNPGNNNTENICNGNPKNSDNRTGGGEKEPTVTEPDDSDDKYSRKSSRTDQSQKSSRKASSTEEESSRKVFSDFGGPQVTSSVDVESTTESGVQKTSVTKSEKMQYSSCEFESSRKSTVTKTNGDCSPEKKDEDKPFDYGESRKFSDQEPSADETSTNEDEVITKSKVEEIIKQELNKVFQMAQTMEKTNFSFDKKSDNVSSTQTFTRNLGQSAIESVDQSSIQKVKEVLTSSQFGGKTSFTGEVITKTGKITSGLTIAPDRPFTPQSLENNYPLAYENIPQDFPPPKSLNPPTTKSSPGYIPVTGGRNSPLLQALTIASERPYSPLPTATVIETPSFITPPKPQSSSMLEALTTAPSAPFTLQEVSTKGTVEETINVEKQQTKNELSQKYAPKPPQGGFKPIITDAVESGYISRSKNSDNYLVESFKPVSDELKSAFKTTSKAQSTVTKSERQQTEISGLTIKSSQQRSSSASRTERSLTPSGLHPPNLLPYYQRDIGEIPLAHRSNSPVPHQIKAPSITPPRAQSVPRQTERRGSVKAMSDAYTQQVEAQNNKYQSTASAQGSTSVSYISAGAYSSGSVTKTYSYEQDYQSIDSLGYHASPLAGKVPITGEKTLPKCSSPLLGKLDHTKQVFKPAIPPQQPTTIIQSSIAEQANLRQAPPYFLQEKEKLQAPWAVVKEKEKEPVPSSKPPQPPLPQLVSKPSLPSFSNVNKTLPTFPALSKPSLPGLSKIPSAIPDAGPGGAPKSGSTAGTTAPRRGRGVLNAAVSSGARIPLCGSCNSQIRGPFITALGKIWCPEHFTCVNANCRRPLQDIGFVEEGQGLYCEFCFEQYLAPTCSKCNAKVKGDCLNAIGKHFHPECFTCAYCGKLFGNSPFFLEDALPYCETDWNELFTTKCFSCGFPIEAGDRWVEALNNNYHSQCFNCTMCKKNLEGQSFFAKGGRPFCKNHAR